ncbi:MAG: GntR family transcriptional regulator [Sphaerochaetaceae bacterium]
MSKYSEIADILKKEIKEGLYASTGKLPTEYNLVSRFQVSRQTIRQAISCLKNNNLVYQVQGSGTYVATPENNKVTDKARTTTNIVVICTYISDYIFPSIIRGIEKECSGSGYMISLVATGNRVDKEREILQKILSRHDVDGIIVEGSKTGFPNPNISLYRQIMSLGIPIVFLHCTYPELEDAVVVGMDDYEGGKTAAKLLVAKGCHKIGGIFKSDDKQGLLRYSGFSDEILEAGLGLDSAIVRWFTTEDLSDSAIFTDAKRLKEFLEKIDGIVCYNDQIAVTIIKLATNSGIALPELISFDNSPLNTAAVKSFMSLGHRKEYLGEVAAIKIKNMLTGQKEESVFMAWEGPCLKNR